MPLKMNWTLYGAVVSANLVTVICGISYSWTSPVLPKLNSEKNIDENPFKRPVTPFEESWLTCSLSIGASVGPFLGAVMVDRIGRKKTLLLLAVPTIVSHLILAFATHINLFYFGRFFLGIGMGCIYSVVPMYVGEIAEDSNRGSLGTLIGAAYTAGTLFSFTVGPYLTVQVFSLVILIPAVTFVVLFGIFFPESPYYLLMVNKEEEARLALDKLRRGVSGKELEEIRKNIESTSSVKFRLKDILGSKPLRKGLMIGSGLVLFQQCSGITVIISYMQSIFDASGTNIPAEISPMIIGSIQLSANFMTSQLVDRLGRRILLLTSLLGAFLSHVFLGLYFYLKTNNFNNIISYLSWLPICSLILFIVMFTVGLGPVTWAILGELFPTHVKSYASTFVTFICVVLTFLLTLFFPNFIQIIGMAYTFWIFAGFCAVGIVFVWIVLPETKGKSLHEIQLMLEYGRS